MASKRIAAAHESTNGYKKKKAITGSLAARMPPRRAMSYGAIAAAIVPDTTIEMSRYILRQLRQGQFFSYDPLLYTGLSMERIPRMNVVAA
jgi:hypothetical protein